jgi:hypothetical protein
LERLSERVAPTEVRVGIDRWGRPMLGPQHTDEAGWRVRLMAAFGTTSPAFIEGEIERLIRALMALRDDMDIETKANGAIAAVSGIRQPGADPRSAPSAARPGGSGRAHECGVRRQ